ncbi:Two-component sensor histidine kinase, contains HisKA and HATPase domains [Mucilaginibacter pineti]|uniref:histidine kinase n=1 Tax=Mucilaginibacter pineti TaxID=1391627 RepID=A0A1G6ZI82_9SPHI|nr:histidine kinase dimerization/phosphoacceptor domain -containing protein [Mucilaginibacter pineti]SDE02007.1 Two-component sensor histidine kinase, contains HisKA and HATPase domains [Mucilaginibacter pineti]
MRKGLFLLLILSFSIFPCFSQTIKEQELKRDIALLKRNIADTTRLRLLSTIGVAFYYKATPTDHYLDTALTYVKEAFELSTRLNLIGGNYSINTCRKNLGRVYIGLNDTERGKQLFETAIKDYHIKKQYLLEARSWLKLAMCLLYYEKGTSSPTTVVAKTSTRCLKNAILLFDQLKEHQDEINARCALADEYFAIGYIDSSQAQCMSVIKKYQFSRYAGVEGAYLVLSATNRYRGNYNISLPYILKGIERMEKSADTINREVYYGELAQVYQELGQAENSVIWYRKTIKLREQIPNYPQIAIFRTVGFVVRELIKENKLNEALNEINSAEKRHPPQTDFIKGIVAEIKGYCYEAKNEIPLAEKSYLDMIRLMSPSLDQKMFNAFAKLDIAKFYAGQKKFIKAGTYLPGLLDEGLLASDNMSIQLLLYKVDSAKGNFRSSLNHLRIYKTISDSLFSVSRNKQIAELQIKYKIDQKEKDINLYKKDALLQRETALHANNARNLTFAGIVLVILSMAFLYKNYRSKQRVNNSLNQVILEKDVLLEDKEWLIKEIHHRVKNNLQIVMGLLQRQSAYINNKEALEAIRNSENRMHSIALIHQKLYQSASLDLINMPDYIEEQISYLKDSFDLDNRIHFEKRVDNIELDVAQAVPLGLIFNEAITNAIKYAYSDNETGVIKIELIQKENKLNALTITDYGKGLPVDFDFEKIRSLGINLMKGLSKQLGGKLEINNMNGVSISLSFKTEKPKSGSSNIS